MRQQSASTVAIPLPSRADVHYVFSHVPTLNPAVETRQTRLPGHGAGAGAA